MQSLSNTKLKSQIDTCVKQILLFKHRYKSRKALLKLDNKMLEDIGITIDQAIEEGNRPFWKGDAMVFDKIEYARLKQRFALEEKHILKV